jgi:3-hydroxymyristoyl/3-hydroxydecanoyl-(acyl carrier protein) dehydratase
MTNVFAIKNIMGLGSNQISGTWVVPTALPFLQGHFPNNPVVPAVALIEASLAFLKMAEIKIDPAKLEISRAKFMAVIEPGCELRVVGKKTNETQWNIEWVKVDETKPCSSLSLTC